MKTRTKELMSIGSIPVLALASMLVCGTVLTGDNSNQAPKPAPSLAGDTAYVLAFGVDPMGIFPAYDGKGRFLVWSGTISGGNINGLIAWYMDLTALLEGATHYDDGCVILNASGDTALLVIEESGSTTYRGGGNDPIWRTNGVVTDAGGGYEDWIGRRTHADGDADMTTVPWTGKGTFRVN